MRILRLDLRDHGATVDLHPFISIVSGLSNDQADELVAAVRGLVRGSANCVAGGLVESGGQLLELRGDGTDGIGPLTIEDVFVSLDQIDSSGDPVVLQAELDQLERRAMIDAVQLEEARADLDAAAAARVHLLHQSVSEFDGDGTDDLARIEAVASALKQLSATSPVLREMPDEVRELLVEWERYEAVRDEVQPEIDAMVSRIEGLEADVTSSKRMMSEAVAMAVPLVLSAEEDHRVDELAQRAASGKKSKRLSTADEAELAALLDKVGQVTFVGYVMYRMAPEPSAESLMQVEAARLRVEQAETRLGEAKTDLQNGTVAQSLATRLDGVKEIARRYLGPMLPADLGSALRSQVVELENPAWLERVRELYAELVEQQIEVPDDLAPTDLPAWAADWVARAQSPEVAGPSRAQLLGSLAVAEKELERHNRAMNRIDRLDATALESAAKAAAVEARLVAADAPAGTSGERAVALLRPLADRVRSEAGSSVPLVLQGEFRDLDEPAICGLLDDLEVLAQDLQLVILTSRPEAMQWASDAGLRRALASSLTERTG